MSKQTPPAPTASAVGPCPTVIQIVGRPGTGSLPSTIAPPNHPTCFGSIAIQTSSNTSETVNNFPGSSVIFICPHIVTIGVLSNGIESLSKQCRPRSDCSYKEQSDQGLHNLPFHMKPNCSMFRTMTVNYFRCPNF